MVPAIVLWTIAPLATALFLVFFLGFKRSPDYFRNFCFVLMAGAMGLLNSTKEPVSDLQVYYEGVELLSKTPLDQIFQVNIIEPLFHIVTSIISHLSAGSGPFFILFWTSISYFIGLKAVDHISESLGIQGYKFSAILTYTLFVGLGFSIAGQLVRQHTAMVFVFYAIAIASKGRGMPYAPLIFGAMCHLSALLFFPLALIVNRLNLEISKMKQFLLALLFIVLVYGVGSLNLMLLISYIVNVDVWGIAVVYQKSIAYENMDGGTISLKLILELMIVGLTAMFLSIRMSKKEETRALLLAILFFFLVLLVARSTDFLFFRIFYYYYVIVVLGLIIISANKGFIGVVVASWLIISSLPRFLNYLMQTPWNYIDNSLLVFGYSALALSGW